MDCGARCHDERGPQRSARRHSSAAFRFLDNVKFKIMFAPDGNAEDDLLSYSVQEQEEQAEIDARPGKLL